jgi:hypothetical protein
MIKEISSKDVASIGFLEETGLADREWRCAFIEDATNTAIAKQNKLPETRAMVRRNSKLKPKASLRKANWIDISRFITANTSQDVLAFN